MSPMGDIVYQAGRQETLVVREIDLEDHSPQKRQSPRYWLNLQSRYDMDTAEDELGEQVAREVRPFTAVA